MNSFIGWIGGKRALRNEILQRMPADIGRYIEVFGGAGWVLFGREPSSKVMEVFNDYDAELVNIPKAGNEFGNCAFAATGRPYQGCWRSPPER